MMHLNNNDDMTIYDADSNVIYEAPITKDDVIKRELMGDFYVQLSFNHTDILPLSMGSYIYYEGLKFCILDEVVPERFKDKRGFAYNIKFYAPQHRMKHRKLRWLRSSRNEMSFSLTTDIGTFAKLIVDNMSGTQGHWEVGTLPNIAEVKNIRFDKKSCWDGVVDISKAFDVEWWVTMHKGIIYLHFGKLSTGDYEEFKVGDILSSYEPTKGDDTDYGTRFYIFGGSRNIPSNYYNSEQGGSTNHISEKRLHLPNGVEYIDSRDDLTDDEVIEQVVYFDDIYPKNTERVTSWSTVTRTINGEQNPAYIIECANSNFDHTIEDNIIDAEIGASFTSGSLNGREFKLIYDKKNLTKRYEIVAITESAGGDDVVIIPNEYLHPAEGDTFVLTGVKLPDENIAQAESELLLKGNDYVANKSANTLIYKCHTNAVFCTANGKNYDIGQKVRLVGPEFGENGRLSRIQGYEKRLFNPHVAVYDVGNNKKYSRFGNIVDKIVTDYETAETATNAIATHNGTTIRRIGDVSYTLASDRQIYAIESNAILSEYNSLTKGWDNFITQWEKYIDANGEEYMTANGDVYMVKVYDVSFAEYHQVYKRYADKLHAVLASTGIPQISESFKEAQRDYYEVRAKLYNLLSDGQKQKISDLDYLKAVFGADKVANFDGVSLSSMVSVKDELGNIVAGMYGGGVDLLNKGGYKDDDHGTLMLFAGAPSVQNPTQSKFRVYEDGTVYAKDGVFEGVVKHKVVNITKNNIDAILPNTQIDGGTPYRHISTDLMSAIMSFGGTTSLGSFGIELPSLVKGQIVPNGSDISKDELRGLVGARFIVYNHSAAQINFCGSYYNESDGTMSYMCPESWIIPQHRFGIAECKIGIDSNGYEVIYWDIKVGQIWKGLTT